MCAASFALLPGSSEEAYTEIEEMEAKKARPGSELKHGRYESKDSNGNLKSVVNYQYGKKHGVSYLYYPNGKVHLEMSYHTNLREGTSRKYYKTGELYATTPYVNNKIEGLRKTFYESGTLRASVPYHNSWPGMGLQEFKANGSKRALHLGIQVRKEGNVWMFKAEEPCRKATYYLGNLVDGQYLDKNRLVPLKSTGDGAVLDVKEAGGESKLNDLEIICRCTTAQNNPLILSRKL